MRRLVVLVAMLVPLSLFAAGCGGAGSSSVPRTDAEKAEMKKKMEESQQQMREQMAKKGKVTGVPADKPTPEK